MTGEGSSPVDRRQAWFGPAYVAPVAAQAGYAWTPTAAENDIHSLDGDLALIAGIPTSVQIKCCRRKIQHSKSYAIERAWRENWGQLLFPAYFVVVAVAGNEPDSWLDQSKNMKLFNMLAHTGQRSTQKAQIRALKLHQILVLRQTL